MKKFAINYSRAFPDHRVPSDYHFNKQLMKGPSNYIRLYKDAMNATGAKYFHLYLTLFSTLAFAVASFWKFSNKDDWQTQLNKTTFPGYKYAILSQRGGFGAYDNILQKFQKEAGGIKDLPWNS